MLTYRDWLRLAVAGFAPAMLAACSATGLLDETIGRDAAADDVAIEPPETSLGDPDAGGPDSTAGDDGPDATADAGDGRPGDSAPDARHADAPYEAAPAVCKGVDASAGDGGLFLPAVAVASGQTSLKSVAVADLDRDGKLDLVVVGSSVGSLRGNGDGTFHAPVESPGTASPHLDTASIGDFNGDGKPDLVSMSGYYTYPACADFGTHLFLGDGAGEFQAAPILMKHPAECGVKETTVLDFNGDGLSDFAIGGFNGEQYFGAPGRLYVDFGSPTGELLPSFKEAWGSYNEVVCAVGGDFDGDGVLDLVSCTQSASPDIPNKVIVNHGSGDGGFTPAQSFKLTNTGYGAAGDFNGDGRLDLVVLEKGASLAVFLGGASGKLEDPVPYDVLGSPTSLVVADFDGDGHADILTGSDQLALLLGKGDGTFRAATPVSAPALARMVVADLNGDGLPDLAGVAKPSDESVQILLNAGCR